MYAIYDTDGEPLENNGKVMTFDSEWLAYYRRWILIERGVITDKSEVKPISEKVAA